VKVCVCWLWGSPHLPSPSSANDRPTNNIEAGGHIRTKVQLWYHFEYKKSGASHFSRLEGSKFSKKIIGFIVISKEGSPDLLRFGIFCHIFPLFLFLKVKTINLTLNFKLFSSLF